MIQQLLEFDDRLFILLNQTWAHESLDSVMIVLSSSKTFVPFYVWGIYKLIKRYKRKFYIPVLLAVVAFGLADSISSKVFKPNFKRVRPAFEAHLTPRTPDGMPGGKYGFVSSHSANAFAVYPLLVMMIFYRKDLQFSQNNKQRMAFAIALFVAFWIAYSRVYLGRHYVGDVFFGGILGAAIGHLLWRVYRKFALEKELLTDEFM
jgi:undecaprenyl-diphosphatase